MRKCTIHLAKTAECGFLEQFSTNTPQIWLTALEAIAGLIIEGVFIAMLIQRFFGK